MSSRKAAYGATFPFSPRYADRYMPATGAVSAYGTYSYMFGGNWVLMRPLSGMTPDQFGYLGQEIAGYKAMRPIFNGAKVYHIQPPTPNGTDAIEAYNPALDAAVAIITRAAGAAPQYVFKPQGLNPAQRYTVSFEVYPSVFSLPGAQLMSQGVTVPLLTPYSSDIAHIDPMK